jgi:hypothetical protein
MSGRYLIWVDWIAAGSAGILMLYLCGWLAELYSLPVQLLQAIGVVNIAYGCASFTVAILGRGDQVPLFRMIAVANMLWAVVCLVLAVVWFGQASVFGMIQLIGEGILVGGLGLLEWRTASRWLAIRHASTELTGSSD